MRVATVGNLIDFTGVEDLEATRFEIYPNPNNGQFNIDINTGMNSIEIYDNAGSMIYSETNLTEGQMTIELGDVARGTYVVRIIGNNSSSSKMLIIQ